MLISIEKHWELTERYPYRSVALLNR